MPLECFWWFVSGVKKIKDKWCRLQCYSVKFQTNFLSKKPCTYWIRSLYHIVCEGKLFFLPQSSKKCMHPATVVFKTKRKCSPHSSCNLVEGRWALLHLRTPNIFLYDSFISPWELKWRRFYLQGIIIYAFIIASATLMTKTWWCM